MADWGGQETTRGREKREGEKGKSRGNEGRLRERGERRDGKTRGGSVSRFLHALQCNFFLHILYGLKQEKQVQNLPHYKKCSFRNFY